MVDTPPIMSSSHDAHGGWSRHVRSEGPDMRRRVTLAMVMFALAYLVIAGRLVSLGLTDDGPGRARLTAEDMVAAARPDLVDRNGKILATDIRTDSLFAEPRKILDVDEAIELLSSVLPELGDRTTRKRLASNAGFVWLKREITPAQKHAIHRLGIPGIGFLTENRRFYPGGPAVSHIVGHVNVDNEGIAGIEKHVDGQGLAELHQFGFAKKETTLEPVKLAVDLRVQHAVRDEISRAMERFQAIAGIGIVLDVHTGEVIAMSSLPDYDPNDPVQALEKDRMNRATAGVFEMGSVFKTFNTAMALDSGQVTLESTYDATRPIRVGGRTISDFHGKHRVLTVPEVLIYSSNIGSAKMALQIGREGQKEFLTRLGLTSRLETDLPEVAKPLVPSRWSEVTSMTVAFGHGISVSPMQTAVAAAALVNGGKLIPPTFLVRSRDEADALAKRVIEPKTSNAMRYLFRLNAEKGSGRQAEVEGYLVGGKTGTAEKVVDGRYSSTKRFNSFLSAFPMDDPRYVVLVVIDEPKKAKDGGGVTAGWNAAPTVANVVRRIAPMLGVAPRFEGGANMHLVSY
ncbi:MAG: cell division protein [Hyphomicrobiales bacterium]|nr:MAG: cell division protein [Hyphomicrobiales bacterium]